MKKEEEKQYRTVPGVCGQEALALLNCIAQKDYDQEKCRTLMDNLRSCVLNEKVSLFTLANLNQPEASLNSKGKKLEEISGKK